MPLAGGESGRYIQDLEEGSPGFWIWEGRPSRRPVRRVAICAVQRGGAPWTTVRHSRFSAVNKLLVRLQPLPHRSLRNYTTLTKD